jgi:hypothetical protein
MGRTPEPQRMSALTSTSVRCRSRVGDPGAALKARLNESKGGRYELLETAVNQSLLPADMKERLDAGRQLRNLFSHLTQQTVWTPPMCASSIAASHDVVALLYPAAAASATSISTG